MAQFEGSRRYIETSSPKTPGAQYSPTFEQIIQGDASWQFSTSPTLARNHDPEEVSSRHTNKKSVLTRVKEKARKLRQSLSTKKKHNNDEIVDGQTTPSWGVSLEDVDYDDEEDEDPEYLGAPMYESELAPESYKETARQHPRADPVVSEKHVWPTSIKHKEEEKDNPAVHSKTITETVSEKLAPAYAAVSDATHTIASRIAGLTISSPEAQRKHRNPDVDHFTPDDMKHLDGSSEIREHLSHKSPQKWDKGVSMKEYFMNKLEPGEDDRALSQVISEAISPKKSPCDMGMVDKVRDAVTSFLRHEEHPESAAKCSTPESSVEKIQARNLSQNIPFSTKTEVPSPQNTNLSTNINSLSHVPISFGASSMEKPHKETTKATNLSSNIPVSTERVVSPPSSISSSNVNSSHISVSPRARYTEEPSKETIKAKNLSSDIPISTKTEVPPPNCTSSASVNTSSHVPLSTGASHEPRKETAKATNMSSNVPLFIKTEVPPLNSIYSTNVNSLSHVPNTHGANSEEPSREIMTAANLPSHNPLWIKTEVPPTSSVSSSSVSPLSRVSLFRSVSLSSHVPVFHNASSSPLIPISPNDQEDLEEQTQGRILQAN